MMELVKKVKDMSMIPQPTTVNELLIDEFDGDSSGNSDDEFLNKKRKKNNYEKRSDKNAKTIINHIREVGNFNDFEKEVRLKCKKMRLTKNNITDAGLSIKTVMSKELNLINDNEANEIKQLMNKNHDIHRDELLILEKADEEQLKQLKHELNESIKENEANMKKLKECCKYIRYYEWMQSKQNKEGDNLRDILFKIAKSIDDGES